MGRKPMAATSKRKLRPLYLSDAEWALVRALMFALRKPDAKGTQRPLRTSGQFWRRLLLERARQLLRELESSQDPYALILRTEMELAEGERRPGDPRPGRSY